LSESDCLIDDANLWAGIVAMSGIAGDPLPALINGDPLPALINLLSVYGTWLCSSWVYVWRHHGGRQQDCSALVSRPAIHFTSLFPLVCVSTVPNADSGRPMDLPACLRRGRAVSRQ